MGRAYLALAVYHRYSSRDPLEHVAEAAGLLTPAMKAHARKLGMGLRLAFTITGGAPGLLPHCALRWDGKTLVLTLSGPAGRLTGPEVDKQICRLAQILGCKIRLKIKD